MLLLRLPAVPCARIRHEDAPEGVWRLLWVGLRWLLCSRCVVLFPRAAAPSRTFAAPAGSSWVAAFFPAGAAFRLRGSLAREALGVWLGRWQW